MKLTVEFLLDIQQVMLANLEMVEGMLGFERGSRFEIIIPRTIDQPTLSAAVRNDGCFDVIVDVRYKSTHNNPDLNKVERLVWRAYPISQTSEDECLKLAHEYSLREAYVLVLKDEFFERFGKRTWLLRS